LFTRVPVKAATGTNKQLNFQARLLTNTGAVVADGTYNVRFKIYQDGTGCVSSGSAPCSGTLKWTETRQNSASQGVVVKNGYFSVNLGSVTAFGSSVDWNQDTLWLSLDVGGTSTGGSPTYDGEMLPFKRLTSTPYAFNSDTLDGIDSTTFARQDTVNTFSQNQTVNATLTATTLSSATLQNAGALSINTTSGNANITLAPNGSGSVVIGTVASPASKLEVGGDVNISSGSAYKIGGTNICTSSGCTAASGSANYIQNGTSLQSSASFNISGTGRVGSTFFATGGISSDGYSGLQSQANNFNLAPNSSFEVSATGSTISDGWTNVTSNGNGGASMLRVSGQQSDGSVSMNASVTGTTSYSYITSSAFLPVKPLTTYYMGSDAKHDVTQNSCASGLYVQIGWYTSAQAAVSSSNVVNNSATTTSWVTYGGTAQAPSNATFAKILIYNYQVASNPNGCSRWFDNVVFRPVSFDGPLAVVGSTSVGSTLEVDDVSAVGNSASTDTGTGLNVDHTWSTGCPTFNICNAISSRAQTTANQAILTGVHSTITLPSGSPSVTRAQAFWAANPTVTSGSITDNYGMYVANQTSGTNDYGVYIQGADTTALWVDAGITKLDGETSIGSVANSNTTISALNVNEDFSGAGQCAFGCYGTDSKVTINDAQSIAVGVNSQVVTANSSFTLSTSRGINISNPSKGASSTITTNSGLFVTNQTAGTTDYGVYIQGADTYALFVDAGDTRLDGALTVADTVTIGTSDTTGTLLVLDTDTNATETSGIDGAMYYNSAMGQFRCFRDGMWESCATRPIDRAVMLEDEFMSGNTGATGVIGDLNWQAQTMAGTACSAFNYGGGTGGSAISDDRMGILRFTTGAAANTGCRLMLGQSTAGTINIASGTVVKSAVAVAATSNNVMRVGIDSVTNTVAQPTVTGVWWEADPASNANWRYCYATGAAATCAASGTAIAANTFVRLKIEIVSSTAVTFTINGTSTALTGITLGASAATRPSVSCHTLAASAQNCYIDYYQLRRDTSAVR
jgi:hypothetical protein